MSSPDHPSAPDLNPVQVVAEALAEHDGRTTWLLLAEAAVSALLAHPEVLSALAGTPHPGVTRLLARCDQADAAARRGNHTPAGGLVPAIEIRALLGHTTTDTTTDAQKG